MRTDRIRNPVEGSTPSKRREKDPIPDKRSTGIAQTLSPAESFTGWDQTVSRPSLKSMPTESRPSDPLTDERITSKQQGTPSGRS